MDIKEKQAIWLKEKPLFEAKLIHSHLLQFFNFNENTGDYEIKNESVNHTDDEDRKVAYESLNTGWAMWLRAKNDAKAQVVPKINGSIQAHELTISEIKAEIEEGYDLCQDIHLLDALVERGIQIGKILAVPEGFVLVPTKNIKYFSNDGENYEIHDTLAEAKREAECAIEHFSERLADQLSDPRSDGNFQDVGYGIVLAQSAYSIDHIVTQDDINNGDYSYEVGTEILSLYLSEAQEPANDQS